MYYLTVSIVHESVVNDSVYNKFLTNEKFRYFMIKSVIMIVYIQMLIFNVPKMQFLIHKEISINRYDVHEIKSRDMNDILDTLCTS